MDSFPLISARIYDLPNDVSLQRSSKCFSVPPYSRKFAYVPEILTTASINFYPSSNAVSIKVKFTVLFQITFPNAATCPPIIMYAV